VILKGPLEEGKGENERLESELRDTKTILNGREKVSSKVDAERRPEISSDRGGMLNTSRRACAAAAQPFTEAKP
jgi:hypothetical protein